MELEGLKCRYHCGNWWRQRSRSLHLISGVNAAYITVMFLQLFTATAEFATLMSLTTFLTRAVTLSDTLSSVIYGMYGVGTLFWSLIGGPLIDRMGFKIVMIFGCLLGAVGRILMSTLVFSPVAVGICITMIIACGDAWSTMALIAATKGYIRNEQLLKVLFGVNYGVMNMGAIAAGAFFDAQWTFPQLANLTLVVDAGMQSLNIIAGIAMSAAFVVSIFMPRAPALGETRENETKKRRMLGQEHEEQRLTIEEEEANLKKHIDAANPILPEHAETEQGGWLSALTSASFWRVALFAVICVAARTIFLHVNATFPTVLRHLYGLDAPIGALYMINPLFITFLAPLIQLIVAAGYTMPYIIAGTAICAISPLLFIAAAPSSLGLTAIVLFAVVLSIGEAMWSPLSRYYITFMAGSKRVGIYLTMVNMIMFIPTIPMGYYSSILLATFCPSDVNAACQVVPIALIISGVAFVTPLLLVICVKIGLLQTPKQPTDYTRVVQGRDQTEQHESDLSQAARIPLDDLSEDPDVKELTFMGGSANGDGILPRIAPTNRPRAVTSPSGKTVGSVVLTAMDEDIMWDLEKHFMVYFKFPL